MTTSWLDWLLERGERNSRCYDFIEARPFWTKWWFRVGAALLIIGVFIVVVLPHFS